MAVKHGVLVLLQVRSTPYLCIWLYNTACWCYCRCVLLPTCVYGCTTRRVGVTVGAFYSLPVYMAVQHGVLVLLQVRSTPYLCIWLYNTACWCYCRCVLLPSCVYGCTTRRVGVTAGAFYSLPVYMAVQHGVLVLLQVRSTP